MKIKALTGILFFFVFSCQYFSQLKNDEVLTNKLLMEFKNEGETVKLSKITDFEWDSLLILGPYTVIEEIEEELDLNLSNIRQNRINYSDSYNLIVFLKNKKSIKIIEFPRSITPVKKILDREGCKFLKDNHGGVVLTN